MIIKEHVDYNHLKLNNCSEKLSDLPQKSWVFLLKKFLKPYQTRISYKSYLKKERFTSICINFVPYSV